MQFGSAIAPLGCALFLNLAAGCASTSLLGDARTVEPGHTEWSATLGAAGWQLNEPLEGAGWKGLPNTAVPQVDLGARIGMSTHTEVDTQLGLSGFGLGSRFCLHKSPGRLGDIDFALSLGFRVGYWEQPFQEWALDNELAALAGLNFGGGRQLVLVPKAGFAVAAKAPMLVHLGGSLGFYLPITDTIKVEPQITWMDLSLSQLQQQPSYLLQGGIGLMWDP